MELNDKFMIEISKIKQPEIFVGLASLTGARLVKEEKDSEGKSLPRDFNEIFEDIMKKYNELSRKKKRELLKILNKANSDKGGVIDGDSTKNSEEDRAI